MKKVLTLSLILGLGLPFGMNAQKTIPQTSGIISIEDGHSKYPRSPKQNIDGTSNATANDAKPTKPTGTISLIDAQYPRSPKQSNDGTSNSTFIPNDASNAKPIKPTGTISLIDAQYPRSPKQGNAVILENEATEIQSDINDNNEVNGTSSNPEKLTEALMDITDISEVEIVIIDENEATEIQTEIADTNTPSYVPSNNIFNSEPQANEYNVYPTAASDVIHIASSVEGIISVFVFNFDGSIKYKTRFTGAGSYDLDISNFSNGVYILRVGRDNDLKNFKFIKQ